MKNIDVEKVIRLYNEGWSMTALAKRFGVGHSVIRHRLVNNGVELRTLSESVKAMYKVDPSIYKRTGRKPTYKLDTCCLDELTPDSAWILGFYQADGYVSRSRVSITLQPDDEIILKRIRDFLGTKRPFYYPKSPFGDGVSLDIASVELASAFRKWGVKSPKTHRGFVHPELRLNRHYWRGVIDGDGTLHAAKDGRKILRLCGSEVVCTRFHEFICSHGCGDNLNVHPHKSIFALVISGDEAIKIASVLYENATLYLPRKMDIYLEEFCD